MRWPVKHRLQLKGTMPERALLRFKRAQIPVFDVQKKANDCIRFYVLDEDLPRALALYPSHRAASGEYHAYTLQKIGAKGWGKPFWLLFQRTGLLLGALLFCALTLYADGYVFSIEFVGSTAYRREAQAALAEFGIKPFGRYKKGKEDLVCAKLLALDDVSFCSVKKSGGRVIVEMHLDNCTKMEFVQGALVAKHTGVIVNTAVLRGTPLKKAGETVHAGETLVGDWFTKQDGEQVRVEIIARVQIACVYEERFAVETEEEAYAAAYLHIGVEDVTITKKNAQLCADGYLVTLEYTVVERWNF